MKTRFKTSNDYRKKNINKYKYFYITLFAFFILGLIVQSFQLLVTVIFITILLYNFQSEKTIIERTRNNRKLSLLVKSDLPKNLLNSNYRNSQNYIIDKKKINSKLKYTIYSLDRLEEIYTYRLFFRILASLVLIAILGIIGSNWPGYISFILGGVMMLLLIYIFYNVILFYKKNFYFYPRRKKYYTVIKYSPFYSKYKIERKISEKTIIEKDLNII